MYSEQPLFYQYNVESKNIRYIETDQEMLVHISKIVLAAIHF